MILKKPTVANGEIPEPIYFWHIYFTRNISTDYLEVISGLYFQITIICCLAETLMLMNHL